MDLIKIIAKDIESLGGKVYLVGGIVRDEILNIENKDIDLEIHGVNEAELINILSNYGEVNKFGAKFGIYQIKGFDIDFALPRKEIKSGIGHTNFDIEVNPYLGVQEATLRRDLTLNGIYKDVLTNELIDHCGGVKDISNKIIRHINSNTFIEDSLRVLRACQFSARFNFKIADETIELCRDIDLTDIALDRIYIELEKAVLKGKTPSLFFRNLKLMNKLKPFFNELELLNEIDFNLLMNNIDSLNKKNVENVLTLIGFYIGEDNYVNLLQRFTNRRNLLKPIIKKFNALITFKYSPCSNNDYRKISYSTSKFRNDIFELNRVLNLSEKFEFYYDKYLEEVKVPIITSSDLLGINNFPANKIGLSLKKAMELQIKGLTNKEELLNYILN